METILESYGLTIMTVGAIGGLLLIQLLVVDFAGITGGHAPGTPVSVDHEKFLFRAVRAHANTNESVASFVLLVLFALLMSAPANWVNGSCVLYLVGRVGHMCCYYANIKILRSVFFGASLIGLLALLGAGFWAFIT